MNLFDTLNHALTTEVVSKIAKFVDEDSDKTQKALDSINFTLVAGLIKRTSSNMGVNMLFNQLHKGNYNGAILESLDDSISKKAKVEELIKTGDSLLSQLFPAYKSPLTSMVGAYAGIKKASANTLSSLSAAILIDALGKQIVDKKMDTDDLVNYLVEHHEPLFQKAPEDLMEKMIPSLGLQELQSQKFTAERKIPAQKVVKPVVKPVSSLDRPAAEVQELNAKPFPWKWAVIGLAAAALIGGGVYYYLNFYNAATVAPTPTETTTVVDSNAVKKDTLPVAKPDTAKKDTTKTAVTLPTSSEQFSSFGEELNKYLSDATTPVGNVIDMKSVKFPKDSPTADTDSDLIISELADLMKKFPKAQIKILGFANDGVKLNNQSLSLKRAFAVKQKLQNKGIQDTRIDFGTGGTTENKIQIKVVAK